jgi:hypothetical protein
MRQPIASYGCAWVTSMQCMRVAAVGAYCACTPHASRQLEQPPASHAHAGSVSVQCSMLGAQSLASHPAAFGVLLRRIAQQQRTHAAGTQSCRADAVRGRVGAPGAPDMRACSRGPAWLPAAMRRRSSAARSVSSPAASRMPCMKFTMFAGGCLIGEFHPEDR